MRGGRLKGLGEGKMAKEVGSHCWHLRGVAVEVGFDLSAVYRAQVNMGTPCRRLVWFSGG